MSEGYSIQKALKGGYAADQHANDNRFELNFLSMMELAADPRLTLAEKQEMFSNLEKALGGTPSETVAAICKALSYSKSEGGAVSLRKSHKGCGCGIPGNVDLHLTRKEADFVTTAVMMMKSPVSKSHELADHSGHIC